MKEEYRKVHPRYPRLIESHWDLDVEFERVGDDVSSSPPPSEQEIFPTIPNTTNMHHENLGYNYIIIVIATLLSLFGVKWFVDRQTDNTKRATIMRENNEKFQGRDNNSNQPLECQKMDTKTRKTTSVSFLANGNKPPDDDENNKTDDTLLLQSQEDKMEHEVSLCDIKDENTDRGVEISKVGAMMIRPSLVSEEESSKKEVDPHKICGDLSLVGGGSSALKDSVVVVGRDSSRSSFTREKLKEMANQIQVAQEVLGLDGAQKFVQQFHLLEYQESLRREHDNERLAAEFQVRQMEMMDTERRHRELLIGKNGNWASKCIQTRNEVLNHLQRTALWVTVAITLDQSLQMGMKTIRSNILCECQEENKVTSSLSIMGTVFCSSLSPSILCHWATSCYISCISSWSIWIVVLLTIKCIGMTLSDTIILGVGLLLWKQIIGHQASMWWSLTYLCLSAIAYVFVLYRGHVTQRRHLLKATQSMERTTTTTPLSNYELECDHIKFGITLFMMAYFGIFQMTEEGFIQYLMKNFLFKKKIPYY